MKQVISLVVSAALLFAVPAWAAPPVLVNDDFSGMKTGGFSSAFWRLTDTDKEAGTVLITERKGTDMALSLRKGETSVKKSKGISRKFPAMKENFTAEFDFNARDGEHYISFTSSEANFPGAVMLSVSAGIVKAYDANELVAHAADIKYGAWTNIKLYIEPLEGRYSVYIGRELVVASSSFRNADVSVIDTVTISTAATTLKTVLDFDNYRVYRGYPAGAHPSQGQLPRMLEKEKSNLPKRERIILFEESFSKLSGDFMLDNWAVAGGVGTVTVEDEADGREKVLKFNKKETETDVALSVTLTLPKAISEDFTFETYYKSDKESKAAGLLYMFDDAGSNPSGPAILPYNNVQMLVGTASTQVNINSGVAASQWYKLTVYVRPGESLYSVYCNDELAAEDLQFRNPANKNIGRILMGSSYTKNPCVGYLDDIKIYTGPPISADEDETEGGSTIVPAKKVELEKLQEYSGVTAQRLANDIVMCVGKYTAFVNNKPKIIDEDNFMVTPVAADGQILVPVRFVAESLGGSVGYNAGTGEATVSVGANTIRMAQGQRNIFINGTERILDAPLPSIRGRMMADVDLLADAFGKKTFTHDSGLLVVSDRQTIFNPASEPHLISYVRSWFDRQSERNTLGRYSDVYASSRWIRADGQDGQLGTLDVLKRFMATGDKWSYITPAETISSIVNLGVTFQNAINPSNGAEAEKGRLFDGSLIVAPWMAGMNQTWDCVNNPALYQRLQKAVKNGIDNGVTQFQFDDWAGNVSTLGWGGCFCDYCMDGFTQYLKENYNEGQLQEFDAWPIDGFHYKWYLERKYDATDNNKYLSIRTKSPLNASFEEFQLLSTRKFHLALKEYMNEYAGKNIEYSHNVFNFGANFAERTKTFAYDVFDAGMGEAKTVSLAFEAMLATNYLTTGIGKAFIYSPIPEGGNMPLIRMGTALTYATGQHMLVPWDIWLQGDERYFADVAEIGDLFHFVRQYPYLFDGYEIPARLGLLLDLQRVSAAAVKNLSVDIFSRGIPFKDVVSKNEIPYFEITEKDLSGLEFLVESSESGLLRESEKQVIAESGVKLVKPEEITEELANSLRASWAEGYDDVYTVLREIPNNPEQPKVCHVLNRSGHKINNLKVFLSGKYLAPGDMKAILYAPGKDPLILPVQKEGAEVYVIIPNMDIWGILRIFPEGTGFTENYPFQNGWSGINLGTRAVERDGAVQSGENGFTVTSRGKGFNVTTFMDKTGAQDQMSFVYKNAGAGKLQNYAIQAGYGGGNGIGGIMIREYPSANARFVALARSESGELALVFREKDNSVADCIALEYDAPPGFMRLENKEGTIFAYLSNDGINWGEPAAQVVMSFVKPLAGMFCASPYSEKAQAEFADARVDRMDMYKTAEPKELQLFVAKSRLEIGRHFIIRPQVITVSGDVLEEEDIEISYSSSNDAVLTVSENGKVEPVSEGAAEIRAVATVAGRTVSASAAIQVVPMTNEILNEDFNSLKGSMLPEGWRFSNTEDIGGGYVRVVQEPADYDSSLSIYDNTTTGDIRGEYIFEEPYAEALVVEFDFMMRKGADKASGGGTPLYAYDDAGGYAACILASSTSFWYLDNGKAKDITEYTDGKWYKFKVILYPQEHKMDLYIDDVLVVEGGSFRTPVSNIKKLVVGGNVNAVDTTSYWNNFKSYLYSE